MNLMLFTMTNKTSEFERQSINNLSKIYEK